LTETDTILGKDGPDRKFHTPYSASTLVDDHVLEVNKSEPSVRETSHEERDAGPVKAAEMQRVDQTKSALDTCCSDQSPVFIAESSKQTLGSGSASSFPKIGGKTSLMVYILNFTTTKIIDKR
jgi:hypothetical protein